MIISVTAGQKKIIHLTPKAFGQRGHAYSAQSVRPDPGLRNRGGGGGGAGGVLTGANYIDRYELMTKHNYTTAVSLH